MNQSGAPGILLESGTNEVEFLIVGVGSQRYGINVSKVCQIIVFNPNVVYGAPSKYPECLGLTPFRNQTISVLDLAIHLNRKSESQSPRLLVVAEFNQRRTGFVVDAVERIDRVSWSDFEPISASSSGYEGVLGTVQRPEGLIMILDLETILAQIDPSMSIEAYSKDIAKGTEARAKVRILHCEDSPLIQKLVYKMLIDSGFKSIKQAPNGKHGLDLLNEDSSNFDLIISDIEMPIMDGLTFCRTLRANKQLAHIPVLFFSSLINEQMEAKCKAVGANATFSKPQMGQIVSAIDELLKLT